MTVVTEIGVCQAIASNQLPSPTEWMGSWWYAIRFSGVGCIFRAGPQEMAWREPAVWTSPQMLMRIRSVPLVLMHPAAGVLDGGELARRVIGCTVYSFIRAGEPWVIGRVIDREAGKILATGAFDASPSVVFGAGESVITTAGGVLIEPTPALVDHLAVVPLSQGGGVWGVGRGEEPGVISEAA